MDGFYWFCEKSYATLTISIIDILPLKLLLTMRANVETCVLLHNDTSLNDTDRKGVK